MAEFPSQSLFFKKQNCQSRVLLYTDSVPHSCITTVLIGSLATWNSKKKEKEKALTLFLNLKLPAGGSFCKLLLMATGTEGEPKQWVHPSPSAQVQQIQRRLSEEVRAAPRHLPSFLLTKCQKASEMHPG